MNEKRAWFIFIEPSSPLIGLFQLEYIYMYILVTPSVSRPSGNPSLAIKSRDNKVKKVEEYSGGRWRMVEEYSGSGGRTFVE